jgi:hypothetical protein
MAIAIAIAVGSIKTAGPTAASVQTVPVPALSAAPPVPSEPAPAAPQAAALTPEPAPAPAVSDLPAAAAQGTPGGQIWTCTTNGIKTFSNNPCGEKSSLLDVGPINTMNPTHVLPPARTYPPDSHFAPANTTEYTTEDTPEQPEDAYPSYGVALVPYYVRKRPIHNYPSQHDRAPPQHDRAPQQHNRGPQPRNY